MGSPVHPTRVCSSHPHPWYAHNRLRVPSMAETPPQSLSLRRAEPQLGDLLTKCGAPGGRSGGKESTASARDVAVLSRDDVPPEDFVSFLPGERKIVLAWAHCGHGNEMSNHPASSRSEYRKCGWRGREARGSGESCLCRARWGFARMGNDRRHESFVVEQ